MALGAGRRLHGDEDGVWSSGGASCVSFQLPGADLGVTVGGVILLPVTFIGPISDHWPGCPLLGKVEIVERNHSHYS